MAKTRIIEVPAGSNWIRQGDVRLKPVNKIPSGCKVKEDRVLAEGEATGHAHRLVPGTATVLEKDGAIFVDAPEGGVITHDEHGPATLDDKVSRFWESTATPEYDHFTEEARQVRD